VRTVGAAFGDLHTKSSILSSQSRRVCRTERHLRDNEGDVRDVTAESEERGKECSDLLVLLSELYNFQVISCILSYDIINDLLSGKTLSEFRVELLLKILRST
jgi:nucleolar MIF4G domain-containing protein 1